MSLLKWGECQSRPYRINNSTLLVYGTGGIGSAIARIGKGFGTYNIGVNRSGRKVEYFDEVVKIEEHRKVLGRAGIVAIALPLNKYTRKLLTYNELSLLKDEAIIVNVARGDIIDEESLKKILTEKPSIRFGSDVWWNYGEGESFNPRSKINLLPNVIASPHISGIGGKSFFEDALVRAAENVSKMIKDEEPKNKVNRKDYI